MAKSANISIYKLAEQLGVSPTTVSRVLNGRDGIGDQTRQRVWEAARAAGFRPKLSVRRHTVGIVQDFVPDHFIGSHVNTLNICVARALTERSFSIETFGTHNIESITDRYLDAVLAIAWEKRTLDVLRKVSKTIPVVIFNRPEMEDFSSVNANQKQGGEIVARNLWHNGHRKIGLIAAKKAADSESFSEGMGSYIRSQGGSFDDDHVTYSHFRSGISPLKQLISRDITAIFLANSEMTYEVPYLCMEGLGINIPGDLSVIGLDNSPTLQFYRPPITVLNEPLHEMAVEGVKLLQEHIDTPSLSPRKVFLEQQLITRESVANISAP